MSDTPNPTSRILLAALERIFRALARLCLRHGISFDAVSQIAKRAFVEVAHREFRIAGRKQSASRVALLTGLHRKEVGAMMAHERAADDPAVQRVAYSARVIAGWRRDARFRDSRGAPAALPFDGGSPSFQALVRQYGGRDLPGRAVLDELTRVGAVTRTRDGRIRLVARGYVPAVASGEGISIFGTDVADLVATFDHNLSSAPGAGWFQRHVAYDNLPDEAIGEIHAEARRSGQALLERLDRTMAEHDRDSQGADSSPGAGRKRAMLGVYFFAEDVRDEDPDSED